MKIDISKLGYRWKGHYSSTQTYTKGDVVRKDGKVLAWTGADWKQWAADQQNATASGELATPDEGQTLTGIEGQELYVSGANTLEWRYTKGRKVAAAVKLPEQRYGGDCSQFGGPQGFALMTDGTIRAWGRNNNGALGDGVDADRHRTRATSVAFPPYAPPMVKMWRGWYNFFSLDTNGQLWAWGYNNVGQCGVGNTSNVTVPVMISGRGDLPLNDKVVDVHCATGYYGYNFTLVRTENGRVYHMGYNRYGVAGCNHSNNNSVPTLCQISAKYPIKKMFAFGHYHAGSFLIDEQGRMWCAGEQNTIGRVQNNDNPNTIHELWTQSEFDPVKVVYGEESDEHVNAGSQYYRQYMIISEAGNVYSWGHGSTYSSGTNNISDNTYGTTETWVPKLDSRISDAVSGGVGAGWYHMALVVKSDGTMWGIGNNQDSVLGYYGGTNSSWGRVDPGNLGLSYKEIFVRSGRHGKSAAGLTTDGRVVHWGMSGPGQQGNGYNSNEPTNGAAMLPGYVDMSEGYLERFNYSGWTDDGDCYQVCHAIIGDGNVYGWGHNGYAQVGSDDDQENVFVPTPVIL